MREWIDLFEGKAMRMTNDGGHAFRIIENPLPAQIDALYRESHYDELKGVLSPDGNTAYVWNAYYAHHMEALGLVNGLTYAQMFPDGMENDIEYPDEYLKWGAFFIFRGELSEDRGDTDLIERLRSSPVIKRMMGGNVRFHGDRVIAENNDGWKANYETIAFDLGDTIITVDDPTNAGYAAVIHKGKSVGSLSTRRHFIDGKIFTGIKNVEIDRTFRGQGLGLLLYRAMLSHITTAGLASYLPDRVNKKQIPAIFRRLGGVEDGDWVIIPI